MKVLLDTHAVLWFVFDDSQLTATARALIEDPDNDVVLSIASVWEMAIKAGMGRLPLVQPIEEFVPTQLRSTDIVLLPISPEHALGVASRPYHHRDPFDRMLVSQCLVEGIPIISIDEVLDAYGIDRRF
jgi:PIN domain nuclease of toxin-antitoxin system